MISRILTAIYVDNLTTTKQFYMDFLGLVPTFEADWIIQLTDPNNPEIHLTIQPKSHELVPEGFKQSPQGVGITFVVEDCDRMYDKAISLKLKILQPPKNEAYGQRRFLTVDPNGVLIDISSMCEPSPEFIEKYFNNPDS